MNWAALLPNGTPPASVKGDNRLVVVYTDHSGLLYDPAVIPEAEAPRSLKDLGNPKWRGKFMLWQYSSAYIPWIVQLGREPTLAALRAAMQNGAVADTFANEFTRFTAKEYPMVANIGSYYRDGPASRGVGGLHAARPVLEHRPLRCRAAQGRPPERGEAAGGDPRRGRRGSASPRRRSATAAATTTAQPTTGWRRPRGPRASHRSSGGTAPRPARSPSPLKARRSRKRSSASSRAASAAFRSIEPCGPPRPTARHRPSVS